MHTKAQSMNIKSFFKTRLYFTVIVTLFIWTLLLWDYTHGGVPSHHILANEDLPAISNWWGVLLLPLLTWFLLYRIQIRIDVEGLGHSSVENEFKTTFYRFAGSLHFALLLSLFFTYGYPDICGYMILALFPVGLFFRIYRAECLLGFVIGMTFTFGAVLSTGIGSILVLAGAILYVYFREGIIYVLSRFAPRTSSGK